MDDRVMSERWRQKDKANDRTSFFCPNFSDNCLGFKRTAPPFRLGALWRTKILFVTLDPPTLYCGSSNTWKSADIHFADEWVSLDVLPISFSIRFICVIRGRNQLRTVEGENTHQATPAFTSSAKPPHSSAMSDEPEPPRKVYGFKNREFERANPARPPTASDATSPAPDPGISVADSGKINVHDLIRVGAGSGPQLGNNAVVNRDNEVHTILRENLQRDIAAGHYDLGHLDDSKRRRRIRNYWIAMVLINGPLGAFAYSIGHGMAILFALAIAGMALLSTLLTWKTFFLRTHY
jgi:hypothetical protein